MDFKNTLAVCSWSLHPNSPRELIDRVRATTLSAVQLALEPLLTDPNWSDAAELLAAAGITVVSGMMGCVGEDYSTLERIKQTGGVMPDITWPATLEKMRAAAPLASRLGLSLITFHAGFIPHDMTSRDFAKAIERVSTIADVFTEHGVAVALETGQEPAATLMQFLTHLNRRDIGVNFDPANMLLYGSGDPINALDALMPFVQQLHIKDAVPSGIPGTWGEEKPAGKGAVDWQAFFELLQHHNYKGNFMVERESGHVRVDDVIKAATLVRTHAPARF